MKRHRRLRRLTPDAELFRRRAAGETVRELAPDYGVSHTTLSRFFSEDWLAWYAARRLRSRTDLLNHNDARRGIIPPRERRARERGRGGSLG